MSIDIDDLLRHELYLHRLDSGYINKHIYPSLESIYKEVRAIINDLGVPTTQKQMNALSSAIKQAIKDNQQWQEYTEALQEMAVYEVEWTNDFMAAGAGAVVAGKLVNYVDKSLITLESGQQFKTGLWAQFVQAGIQSQIDRIDNLARTAYSRGWTKQELVSEVRTYMNNAAKRDAEALARTGFAHYANGAREAWANQNKDLGLVPRIIVTFDNRISSTCIQKAAQQEKDGDASKLGNPPYHFRCRTVKVWVPEGEELIGTRAAIGGQPGEDAKDAFEARESRTDKKVAYRGRRDNNIFKAGQVRASTPFENWLKSQPAWFIDSVLGESRGKAFRGGEKLSSFYDATGRPLTLEELRAKG